RPPRLPRRPRRDVRADGDGPRVLEDVRDDGLAPGLALGGQAPSEGDREGPGADDHVRPRVRPARGGRRPHGPRRAGGDDGRGVPRPPGGRPPGDREDPRARGGSAGRGVLRVPAVPWVHAFAGLERAAPEGGSRRGHRGDRVGRGVAVEGGGGRGAAGRSPGAIGAMPPIVLRHSTSIRMKRKTTRRSRTTLIAGTPPTSAANGFNPPMCTTSIVDAPVYASRTW